MVHGSKKISQINMIPLVEPLNCDGSVDADEKITINTDYSSTSMEKTSQDSLTTAESTPPVSERKKRSRATHLTKDGKGGCEDMNELALAKRTRGELLKIVNNSKILINQ